MDVVERVQRLISSRRLLVQGESVVVGVSGGPDSLTLLHVLCALHDELALELHVVHVHHGLRGAEADADADFVMQTAREWDVQASLHRADVRALSTERKLSLEEAARQVRYTFLAEEAQRVGAPSIVVGHNADDQSETVLMHFLRGSGLGGLRGMRPVAPLSEYHLLRAIDAELRLVRPLLTTTRADIEAYCSGHGLKPRFDRSNLDRTYHRNRLRHEVLPLLESLNPGVRDALRHSAEVAAADYEVLRERVEAAWDACLLEMDGVEDALHFDRERWRALPLSLQRATMRKAIWHLRQSLRDVTFLQVDNAVRVGLEGTTGAQATLPSGLSLCVDYDRLTVCGAGYQFDPPDGPSLSEDQHLTVIVPGSASLSFGWRVTLEPYEGVRDGAKWVAMLSERWTAAFDADLLGTSVGLRSRQPGDRFRPQGVEGTQKVAHFMVNAKIARRLRNRVPLLLAEDGEIAWVVGWRVDDRYIVGPSTRRIVIARLTQESRSESS